MRATVAWSLSARRPKPTRGFAFHTLEDYHGPVNIITGPRLVPKYRRLIEGVPALIVHGHIERQERSANIIAERLEPLRVIAHAERRVHSFG